jgi:hypothetical protein
VKIKYYLLLLSISLVSASVLGLTQQEAKDLTNWEYDMVFDTLSILIKTLNDAERAKILLKYGGPSLGLLSQDDINNLGLAVQDMQNRNKSKTMGDFRKGYKLPKLSQNGQNILDFIKKNAEHLNGTAAVYHHYGAELTKNWPLKSPQWHSMWNNPDWNKKTGTYWKPLTKKLLTRVHAIIKSYSE